MTGPARRGYLLAKLYGSTARSFLGANFRELLRLKSLTELQARLWPSTEVAAEPAARDLQARIALAGRDAMVEVLEYLEEPPAVLVHLFRRLECGNLKIVLRGISGGRVDESRLLDLGDWATLRLSEGPSFEAAVRRSPWAWTLDAMARTPRAEIEGMIDRAWHVELLRLSLALPARDRTGVLRFVRFQVSLANVVGALRLRFAFGMDEAAAGKLLVPGVGGQTRNAVAEAFRIAPDGAEDWRKWGFGWLLADQLDDSFRRPDPVRAESAASRRLFLRAHQLLHQYPFTLCPLVAWFTLRQREASLLQSAVEKIVLNIPEAEILSLVGEG